MTKDVFRAWKQRHRRMAIERHAFAKISLKKTARLLSKYFWVMSNICRKEQADKQIHMLAFCNYSQCLLRKSFSCLKRNVAREQRARSIRQRQQVQTAQLVSSAMKSWLWWTQQKQRVKLILFHIKQYKSEKLLRSILKVWRSSHQSGQ